MKSSLEIAQEAELVPIEQIAESLRPRSPTRSSRTAATRARSDLSVHRAARATGPTASSICVTGMTPTKAGEGKTTTLVGLTQGLGHIGKRPVACLREPSLGPVFGIKGGAAGGGMTQVVPMEDLNLHFTGDIHAIGAANNLLAAMLDASILHGNPHKIDQLRVGWRRALDMNDRALRNIAIGLGGRANGYPRESGFDITAASEVMAILAVSRDLQDLRARLGRITVAQSFDGGKPITAEDLGAAGAMAVLLKDAIKPNLIQTLEGQPCLMHCGPFANIAHGNNSLVADQVGMKIADYVVTESGFGSDMGMEKFFDIVCRFGELTPSAVVLVTTVRAIKHHGGVEDDPRVDRSQALRAIEVGMANVRRHLGDHRRVRHAGRRRRQPPAGRHERGGRARQAARARGGRVRRRGQRGLHQAAAPAPPTSPTPSSRRASSRTQFKPLYDDDEPIQDKIEAVAKRVYGATRRLLLSRGREEADAVHRRRARPLPGLHGQDAPVAVVRPDAAQRAGALHAAGARHPRLHGRRLARAAVRRHHADARPRQDAGRAERRHRRRGADRRALLAAMG